MTKTGKKRLTTRVTLLAGAALILAGCEDGAGPGFDFLKKKPETQSAEIVDATPSSAGQRDVEAPDVFSANEDALWDGRPSLGGIWVAFPGVKSPERVIIRNESNGKSIVGALFRRERENPGPRLQMSSDAAEALGMLAGQPTKVSVIALTKEDIPGAVVPDLPSAAAVDAPLETASTEATLPATSDIEATPIDPVAAATAAIDRADAPLATVPTPTPVAATPDPVLATPASKIFGVTKPFIQVGTYAVKENADQAAATLRSGGVLPVIKEQAGANTTFYRVLVGPATNRSERRALRKTVNEMGFSDSYFVSS